MKNKIRHTWFLFFLLGFYFFAMASKMDAQPAIYLHDISGNQTNVFTGAQGSPLITIQPRSQVIGNTSPVTLTVTAKGAGISYQWLSNGLAIAGATNDSLFLRNLPLVNSTNFSVIVSNSSGTVTSSKAALWVDSNANGLPDWWETQYFGNLNQLAAGDYDTDGVSNMDEYREGTNPASSASFNPRLTVKSYKGTVTVSPNLPYYSKGQVITLTAAPDAGQLFTGWSGAANGTSPQVSLTMNNHQTAVANFGIPLVAALNDLTLNWTTGGDASWFGQVEYSKDGIGAAQSGAIVGGQQSWIQTTVTLPQPTKLSFWWAVASQAPDALVFSLNGSTIWSITDSTNGWQEAGGVLNPGTYTLRWTYIKYSNGNPTGIPVLDSAWLDMVSFTQNPCFSPPVGILSWWQADDTSLDAFGSNHGTIQGGVTYANGLVGKAFQFDGTTGYVQVGDRPNLRMTNMFTFEGWIYPTGAGSGASGGGGVILSKEGEYALARFANGTINWAFATAGTGGNWGSGSFIAPLNQWSHIALTYSNGVVRTYGNGSLTRTHSGSGNVQDFDVDLNDFRIGGRQNSSQFFAGLIDELSVYGRVLSSEEIIDIYAAYANGKCRLTQEPFSFSASRTNLQMTAQGFSLTLRGLNGSGPVVIYGSTDLTTWLPIFTNPAALGTIQLQDPNTNTSRRFYKATQGQ